MGTAESSAAKWHRRRDGSRSFRFLSQQNQPVRDNRRWRYRRQNQGGRWKLDARHNTEELVRRIRRVGELPWLVSYGAAPELSALYEGFTKIAHNLSHSAAKHYYGSELMFFSPGLEIPAVEPPANIYGDVVDEERGAGAMLF